MVRIIETMARLWTVSSVHHTNVQDNLLLYSRGLYHGIETYSALGSLARTTPSNLSWNH